MLIINSKGERSRRLWLPVQSMLPASNHRVLLVDLDPQCHVAKNLGYTHTEYDDQGHNLAAA